MIAQILGVILSIIIVVFTIIFVWRIRKIKVPYNIPRNAVKVDTPYRKEFTEGYVSGLLIKNIPRKNGCNFIEFVPDDVDQSEESSEKIKPVRFIAKASCIKPLGRGEYSQRREFLKILPPPSKLNSIPEKMRDTDEGKWVKISTQKAFLEDTFGSIIKTSTEAIASQAVELSTVALSRMALEQVKEAKKQQNPLQGYPDKQDPQNK